MLGRIPVLKQTTAENPISESRNTRFEEAKSKKMVSKFSDKMGQIWPIYA